MKVLPNLVEVLDLGEFERQSWSSRLDALASSGVPLGAESLFFTDTMEPHMYQDQSPVTLSTTDKAMYPLAAHPFFKSQIFSRPGKKFAYHATGKITTAATPGNLTIDIYYGNGGDANGTILASSAAQTLVINQTSISWHVWWTVRCATPGATGTLRCHGWALFGTAVIAVGSFLIPASLAVDSAAVDLTSNTSIVSLQFKRSGSTAETAATQDLEVVAMN